MKNEILSQSEKPAKPQPSMQIGPSRQIAMAASSLRDATGRKTYSFNLIAERTSATLQVLNEIQAPRFEDAHWGLND
jgi:hypothetical protein